MMVKTLILHGPDGITDSSTIQKIGNTWLVQEERVLKTWRKYQKNARLFFGWTLILFSFMLISMLVGATFNFGMVGIALIFFIRGAYTVFGRVGFTYDLEKDALIKWRGWLIFGKQKSYPLGDLTGFKIPYDAGQHVLSTKPWGKFVLDTEKTVISPQDLIQLGERLSEFTGKPLERTIL